MNIGASGSQERSDSRLRSRRVAFTIIAAILPFALLAAVELGLRIAGVGAYPPLFVPAANADGYLQPNEAAMSRFFARAEQAPEVSIDTTYFRADKPEGTLRIVVQGGSSAAGFPYGKWASPAGMLKRRLRASFPERDIEVISTAMSAVNSYSLLDFADEIVALEPDAVIVYAGHNEYLGVLGVGSAYTSSRSPALTRAILGLRRLRLYRSLETLLTPVPDAPPSGTLMARIAGERSIPYGSELFQRGVEQFRDNLDRLLRRYRNASIPVFVGTLASNEREQPPFTSALAPGTDREAWEATLERGLGALDAGNARAALEALGRAVELDDGAADAWFAAGRAHFTLGRHEEARAAFAAARDRDQLRFRAPAEFNVVIEELAAEHGATLVDVRAALAAESPGGIVGSELMLEHLHPNVRGYFLLADAYFDSLIDAGIASPRAQALDDESAWRQRPVTRIDDLAAGYRLQRLLADWPFEDTPRPVSLPPAVTPEEQIAQAWYTKRLSWPDAMNRALVYYQQQRDIDNAVRVALNLAEAFHFLGNVQYIAGQLLMQRGDTRLAVPYLERSVELQPVTAHYLGLATAYRRAGRSDEARRAAQIVLQRDPGNREATTLLETLAP